MFFTMPENGYMDNSDRKREWRKKKRALVEAGDPSVPHGTNSGYVNWGCTCRPCYEACLRNRAQRYLDIQAGK